MAIRKVIPRSLDSAAASANLSFDANTLFVDSTNNVVGINTATPNSFATGLAVYNATNPSVAIVSGNANSYLRLSSTSDSDMYLSNVGGAMTFSTAATSRMTINSSGNVSIGTTSPTPLVGAGKYLTLSNISHATLSIQAVDSGNDRNATLELLSSGNGGSSSQIVYGDTDTTPGTASPLIFTGYHSGTSTERMRITATGNVGIGTASPRDVAGYVSLGLNDTTGGLLDFYANGTRVGGIIGVSGNLQIGTATATPLIFNTDTNERMRIDSSGNVGIGTSSPTSKLQIGTGAASSTVQAQILGGVTVFENAGASANVPTLTFNNDLDTGINNPSGNTLALYTGGTERVRIDSSGNVGIGTGSPARKLVVSGGASEGVFQVTNTTSGVGADDGLQLIHFTNGESQIINRENGPMLFYTNNTERIRIPADAGGIKFPATQVASTDANTLDDYEEGTWTPSVGGTATYSQQGGTYTKIGRLVYVSFILQIATIGTGSNNTITGIPFTAQAGPRNTIPLGYFASTNGTLAFFTLYIGASTADMKCVATTGAATGVSDAYGAIISGTYIMGSGCYHAS